MANNKIIDLDRLSRFKDKLDNVLETKANVDGNYPTMTVGSADSLTPYGENSGAEDDTPFVFQTSGGSSDVGSKAYLRELRGNSVAFNQGFTTNYNDGTWYTPITSANATITKEENKFTITLTSNAPYIDSVSIYNNNRPIISGHKYLIKIDVKHTGSNDKYFQLYFNSGYVLDSKKLVSPNTLTTISCIATASATSNQPVGICSGTLFTTGEKAEFTNRGLFDLTLMFGAGNEPTSVAKFNALFPKAYYDYNVGTLLSCKVNGIKNVGYNAFDGQWEIKGYDSSGNINTSDTQFCTSVNYIRVVSGQTYTFEKGSYSMGSSGRFVVEFDGDKNFIQRPSVGAFDATNNTITLDSKTQYVKIMCYISGYNFTNNFPNDIAFHLTWDESRTGYEPYEEWQYNLPNLELRSAGSAYDVAYSTGGGKRRIGVLDLGTLTGWGHNVAYGHNETTNTGIQSLIKKVSADSEKANMVCSKYVVNTRAMINQGEISINPLGTIVINDSNLYTMTDEQIQTALSGVYLYYELATETDITTEENPGWTNPQDIDDFGTQEFLYDSDIVIPVPQGNDFFYPVDYKAFVDSLGGREDIEYDASEIVSHTELQNAITNIVEFKTDFSANDSGTITNTDDIALLSKFINQQIFPSVIKIKAKYATSGVITSNYYIVDGRLIIKYGSYNNNGYWGLRISYYDNTYTHLT